MQVLNVIFYGLPVEQLQNVRERVNAVTADDIQRVARAYLRPDRLSVVLVGNAAAFVKQLKDSGFGLFETVELTNLDLTATDFKRTAASGRTSGVGRAVGTDGEVVARRFEPTAVSPVGYRPLLQQSVQAAPPSRTTAAGEGEGAKALLDHAVAAKGGLQRLRAIRTIAVVTSASAIGPDDQSSSAQTRTYLAYPDRVRVETTLPNATIVEAFDGQRAWVQDPRGVHDVPDALVEQLRASLQRDTIALLLAAEAGTIRVRALSDVKDDAGARRQAIELSAASLEPIILYLDPASGLVTKQTYVVGGAGQPLVEELFADYRAVEGVQMPFATTVRRGGQPILERRITALEFNVPIDPIQFTRPRP